MARNYSGKGGGSDVQYKKEYCKMLIDHMSEGYSFSSFGADIDKGRTTLYEWLEKYPEFKKAKETGHEKAKKYYEKILQAKLRGKEIRDKKTGELLFDAKKSDTTLLIFCLKTRFKDTYGERIDIDHTTNGKSITLNYNLLEKIERREAKERKNEKEN